MTEQLNIPELRRLHAAATPGEWCYDDGVTDLEGTPDAERGRPAWITTRGNKLIAEPSGTNGELACIPNLSEMDANGKCIAASHNALPALLDAAEERDALKAAKDGAYQERDRLVALISKVFPACLARHPDSDTSWDNDWRWIVFVLLPTGQASWHIHDSELAWFKHLPRTGAPEWDGHTTDEKYRRVDAVGAGFFGARMLSENVEEPQP